MAGTVTLTHYEIGHIRTIVATIVADASDGSVPATVLPAVEGRLLHVATRPGSTAPSDEYDLTVEDQYGHDVLEGVGADRSNSAAEKAAIVYAGTAVHPVVDESDTLTLKIANNSEAGANITVALTYALGS